MTTNFQSDLGSTQADQTGSSGAKEQAQQAAGTAAEQGRQVAGTAQEEAARVASEASSQLRSLMDEAAGHMEEQSAEQQKRLAGTVRTFADDLDEMRSGSETSGLATQVMEQVTQRARDLASRLESREPRELLDDVRSFARRRPGTFLLGALAAGVVAGRVTRGAKAANADTSPTTVGATPSTPSTTSISPVPVPDPAGAVRGSAKTAPIPPTDDDASPAYLSDAAPGSTAGPGTGRS